MANKDDDGNENENSGSTLITKVDDLLIEKTSQKESSENSNELDFRPFYIQIVSNPAKGSLYKLVNKLEIGSGKGQVLISHPSVSHLHCTITNVDGEITVTDHGSTNGTYVGGKKIPAAKKIKIAPNDHILVGQVEIVLLQKDETEVKTIAAPQKSVKPKDKKTGKPLQLERKVKGQNLNADNSDNRIIPNADELKNLHNTSGTSILNIETGHSDEVAGAFTRIFAYICDLCILIILYPFIAQNDHFNALNSMAWEIISKDLIPLISIDTIGKILLDMDFILPYILTYGLLQVIGNLLFGVSISQFLLGLGGGRNFLWDRIGGILRSLVDMVLSPLFILDFPTIINVRSAKEWITFTKIVVVRKWQRNIGCIILTPLFILATLLSPVLQDEFFLTGINFPKMTSSRSKVAADPAAVYSNHFKMNFNLGQLDKFVLLPAFEITQTKDNKKITPYFEIYNKDEDLLGTFKVVSDVNILGLMKQFKRDNFLTFKYYPKLDEFLNAKKQTPSKEINLLFERIFSTAFELKAANIVEHVEMWGPFVKSYLNLRKGFLNIFPVENVKEVKIVRLGNLDFYWTEEGKAKYFFAKNTFYPLLFQLTWEKGSKVKTIEQDFVKTVLGNTEWFFDKAKVTQLPESLETGNDRNINIMKDVNIVYLIDFYAKKNISNNQRLMLEQFLYLYLYDYSKEAVVYKKENLKRALIKILDKVIVVTEIIHGDEKISESQSFLPNLKTMKLALENFDMKYFGFN